MKILAMHDGLGCGFVRLVQPLRELARHGHEVHTLQFDMPEAIESLRDAPKLGYDVIIGQRFAGYDGMRSWRRARTPRNRLVYETDDNMFNINRDNWSAFERYGKPGVQDAIKTYSELSDLITVTTDTLAQVQRNYLAAEKVAVLPNCIPEFVLDLPRKEHRRPRIGWCGGASHALDVHEAVPSVRRFLNRNPDWDLFFGGTDYRPSFNARNWDQMLWEDWRQINDQEHEYYEMIDFDIGLVPVRDTVFAQSKSALKCLEYNARGIPVIASNITPYKAYVVHGENGFLVKEQHEWGRYVKLLADNPDLRKEMGEKGKVHASAWTHEANWPLWESAYGGLF